MKTEDEAYLAEAQERMYKSEQKHIWEHFSDVNMELRGMLFNNKEHINNHIRSTESALADIFAHQQK